MKKQLLLVLAVMLSIVAATPANAQRRKAAAINRAVAKHVKNPVLVKDMDNVSIYSGKEKGFVFVSKSEKMPEVLGYGSNTLSQENMPDGMKWILGYYDQLTEAVEAGRVEAPAAYKPEHAVEPLLKTQWAQDAPFWDMLPTVDVDGVLTPTVVGCTATAMAQIMRYYRWPERGHGKVSYYAGNIKQQITADLSESVYDWDNMLDYYGKDGAETEAQRKAVALLSRDAGYSTESSYDIGAKGGTAANMDRVCQAIVNNFGYDKGLRMKYADNYSQEEWAQILYKELAAGRPIDYAGETSVKTAMSEGVGHSFIIDGINEEGLYHVNWGWRGSEDNYFYITALNPKHHGVGGGDGSAGFNYYQCALIGFQKPVEGSKYMPYNITLSKAMYNINPTDKSFSTVELQLKNQGYDTFDGTVYSRLVNVSTNEEIEVLKCTSSNPVHVSAASADYATLKQDNSISIPDGEYTLRCYSTDKDGNVDLCAYSNASARDMRILVKDNKLYYTSPITTIENFKLVDADYDAVLFFKFEFDVVNNTANQIPAKTIQANIRVVDEDGEPNSSTPEFEIPALQPNERYHVSAKDEVLFDNPSTIRLVLLDSPTSIIFDTEMIPADEFIDKYSGSTAIKAATTASGNTSSVLYNIMGQRISAPQHGLYIKDGKVRVRE